MYSVEFGECVSAAVAVTGASPPSSPSSMSSISPTDVDCKRHFNSSPPLACYPAKPISQLPCCFIALIILTIGNTRIGVGKLGLGKLGSGKVGRRFVQRL